MLNGKTDLSRHLFLYQVHKLSRLLLLSIDSFVKCPQHSRSRVGKENVVDESWVSQPTVCAT